MHVLSKPQYDPRAHESYDGNAHDRPLALMTVLTRIHGNYSLFYLPICASLSAAHSFMSLRSTFVMECSDANISSAVSLGVPSKLFVALAVRVCGAHLPFLYCL